MPEHFNASYVASIAVVLGLTQALAADLMAYNVRMQAVLSGLPRTETFGRTGIKAKAIEPEMATEATELVDAALFGFDNGETVTIRSLPAIGLWDEMERA